MNTNNVCLVGAAGAQWMTRQRALLGPSGRGMQCLVREFWIKVALHLVTVAYKIRRCGSYGSLRELRILPWTSLAHPFTAVLGMVRQNHYRHKNGL